MNIFINIIEGFLNVVVQVIVSPIDGLMWLLDNVPSISISFPGNKANDQEK